MSLFAVVIDLMKWPDNAEYYLWASMNAKLSPAPGSFPVMTSS